MSLSQIGNKGNNFKDGKYSILRTHTAFKKQECIFGCESKKYHLQHEPPIDYDNILDWEGRLINVSASCHQKIHTGKLFLPELSGIEWNIEKTKEVLEEIKE